MVNASGANIALSDKNGIELGNVTASGTLGVAAIGDISQKTGTAIAASGATTLTSSSGNIALDGVNNDFGVVNASGANIALVDKNALAVTLTATGSSPLTAGADLVVSGSSGSLQASAGQSLAVGSITTVSGDVQLEAVKDIILGELNVQGTLAASTTVGNISQTGPLNAVGTSDLSAPAGKIDLGNTANKFGGLVSFKSPNTVFAGSGAPSNGLEQAIIASVLAQISPSVSSLPSLPSQLSTFSPSAIQPASPTVANDPTGPSSGTASTTATTANAPAVQSPGTLTLSVGGFQVVEVSSAQLAMLQPVSAPSASTTVAASADVSSKVDTNASEPKDSKSQDDAAVRQMVRSTPDALGRVSLFVIDGGIRLPLVAQEERASLSSNSNSNSNSNRNSNTNPPALQRPQERKDRLQQQD